MLSCASGNAMGQWQTHEVAAKIPCVLRVTHVSDMGRSDRDLFLAVSLFPQCKASSRTWGTSQRTTSLALSLIRAVHEAGMRRDSSLRQKNNAFRILLNS